jgi:hypothetical protein
MEQHLWQQQPAKQLKGQQEAVVNTPKVPPAEDAPGVSQRVASVRTPMDSTFFMAGDLRNSMEGVASHHPDGRRAPLTTVLYPALWQDAAIRADFCAMWNKDCAAI